jgi:hypothetical protein
LGVELLFIAAQGIELVIVSAAVTDSLTGWFIEEIVVIDSVAVTASFILGDQLPLPILVSNGAIVSDTDKAIVNPYTCVSVGSVDSPQTP